MARPRLYKEKRVTTAVRLPETLHARLVDEADARNVSVNLLVTKAVDAFLERLRPIEEIDQAS